MAIDKVLDRNLYDRATLPLGWKGKRVFTREQWGQIIRFLKENPDKNLVDYLREEDGMP